jgi:hypothetical protein
MCDLEIATVDLKEKNSLVSWCDEFSIYLWAVQNSTVRIQKWHQGGIDPSWSANSETLPVCLSAVRNLKDKQGFN